MTNLKQILTESKKSLQKHLFAAQFSHDPEHLDRLSKIRGHTIKRHIAKNPHTKQETLDSMYNHYDHHVIESVAKHPNTHPDTLHKMALADFTTYPAYVGHEAVAEHKNTRADTLHHLASNSSKHVRLRVARHPATHPDTLHKLYNDKDADVHREARKVLQQNHNNYFMQHIRSKEES